MNRLNDALDSSKNFLKGRNASPSEILLLQEKFKDIKGVESLLLALQYNIIGHTFKLSFAEDASKNGVSMTWLSPSGQIEEAYQFYPGIIVIKEGYIPIGECLFGSGNPYFLKNDGDILNIYRVLHDVSDDIFTPEMVELVIPFEGLFNSIKKL